MIKNRNAFTIVEYAVLIMFILTAVFVFRTYILRALSGRYKSVGDTYGFGRQYEEGKTVTCGFDDRINAWYDEVCFDNERQKCAPGDNDCELGVLNGACKQNSDVCNKDFNMEVPRNTK